MTTLPGRELVKAFNPYKKTSQMPGMLLFLGLPRWRVYCEQCHKGRICHCGGFWNREELSEAGLEGIAYEAKQAFRQKAKKIQTHFTENHEEAIRLISTWTTVKKLFKRRGVFL